MPLDSFADVPPLNNEQPSEPGVLSHFVHGFTAEARMQKRSLTQLIGASSTSDDFQTEKPTPSGNDHMAEVAGKLVAEAIPLSIGLAAARVGLGRVFSETALKESPLLRPTALGFSTSEAALSGFANGALLTSTDAERAKSFSGLLVDRAENGVMVGGYTAAFVGLGDLASRAGAKGVDPKSFIGRLNPLASYAGAGSVVGFYDAETTAQRDHHRSANLSEVKTSILDMALLGGMMAAMGRAPRIDGLVREAPLVPAK